MAQEADGIFYKKMNRLGTDVHNGFCFLVGIKISNS